MGKTRYKAMLDLLKQIPEEEISVEKLKFYIQTRIATREKTAVEIMKNMCSFGLIEEIGPYRFRIKK